MSAKSKKLFPLLFIACLLSFLILGWAETYKTKLLDVSDKLEFYDSKDNSLIESFQLNPFPFIEMVWKN